MPKIKSKCRAFRLALPLMLLLMLVTFSGLASAAACTNNWVGGGTTVQCTGSVTYTTGTTLTADVNVSANIIINGGVTLTTNGFNLYASNGVFQNLGTVNTGNVIGSGATGTTYGVGASGTSYLSSYGGSGGGGGGLQPTYYIGGAGGATTATAGLAGTTGNGGNGNSATFPTLTQPLITTWFTNGMKSYLKGAGGGAGGGNGALAGNGGNGGYGVSILASNIIAGTIITSGVSGTYGASSTSGGGGGAGSILLLYYKTYTAGTYTMAGGGGGTGVLGGSGGSGIATAFQTLSISTTPSTPTYGSTITIIANSIYLTDTIDIDGPLGTHLATGTGSTTFSVTASNLGTTQCYYANDITMGVNSICTTYQIYLPLYLLNFTPGTSTQSIKTVTPTISPFTWNTYYPAELYTTSNCPACTFTLTQGINTLVSNALNVSYVPPSNSATGNYIFVLTEFQGSNSISMTVAANTLNMNDIATALSCNMPIIQDFPNSCGLTWNVKPTSWQLWGDKNNVSYGTWAPTYNSVWSYGTNNIYPVNAVLTYNGFSPFVANFINNPLLQQTLTQNALTPTNSTSSTTGGGINTRKLYHINSYNESSKLPINTTDILSAIMLINNYTIPLQQTLNNNGLGFNSVYIYLPQSNYNNPTVNLFNQSLSTANSIYAPRLNSYFNAAYNSLSRAALNVYLPPASASSLYGATIYACNNYALNEYLQVLDGPQGAQYQVQMIHMTQIPFSIALLNGYPYQFVVMGLNGQKIYASSLSTWISPITIYGTCPSINVTQITFPNIQSSCSWTNEPGNTMLATCIGTDTTNLVQNWTVQWVNQTTLITSTVLNSITINNPAFSTSYLFPSNKTQYVAIISARYAGVSDPNVTSSFTIGLYKIFGAGGGAMGIIAILFVLVPLVCAYFKLEVLIILQIFVMVVINLLGIVPAAALPPTTMDILILLAGVILVSDFIIRKGG